MAHYTPLTLSIAFVGKSNSRPLSTLPFRIDELQSVTTMKSNLKSARTTHTTQAHRTEVKVMAGKGVGGGVGMGGGGGGGGQ